MRTIKQLESYGLAERRRSSEPERVVYVFLTRSGKSLFKKAHPEALDSVQHRLVDSLNQSERLQLENLLRKLVP
jgi:DNA-binding MarR family transcriptional regulator